jgi:hypothetical protein
MNEVWRISGELLHILEGDDWDISSAVQGDATQASSATKATIGVMLKGLEIENMVRNP